MAVKITVRGARSVGQRTAVTIEVAASAVLAVTIAISPVPASGLRGPGSLGGLVFPVFLVLADFAVSAVSAVMVVLAATP